MELFTQLFGDLLAFVYHCFDRIVVYGYLSGLSRPEQVVHFFRNVVGVATVDKEVLRQRTAAYQAWVEAFARNHRLPIEWAEKGVRKEDHVLTWQRRMARQDAYGVYFIFKSMEQGATFRVTVPKYAGKDPNYRILAPQRSRFTHYYFYIRDEVLRQGTQTVPPVTLLRDRPDRVLPQLHLQAQLPDPQAVRTQLRARPVAADRRQDRRDLRHARSPPDARQARHHHRPRRARPSCLPRLLQERLPQAIRKVLHLSAQRAGLQQSRRFPSQEGIGASGGRAPALPDHHRPLRRLPGTVAQCPCRLPAASAPGPADHRRCGSLSRHQDPRDPHHPPARNPLAWRQSSRRLDGKADPPRRCHQLPPVRECLPPQPAPLRSAQTQRPRPPTARRRALRLPAYTKRRASGAPLSVLSQTPLRPPRQQPLSPPPQCPSPAGQQTRSRIPPRRQRHSTDRAPARRLTARTRLFDSSCL